MVPSEARGEDERRLRLLLALEPPQRLQLVPYDRVRARRTLLDPADVQAGCSQVQLIPNEGRPIAPPVGRACRLPGSWWSRVGPCRLPLATTRRSSTSPSVRCSRVRSSLLRSLLAAATPRATLCLVPGSSYLREW